MGQQFWPMSSTWLEQSVRYWLSVLSIYLLANTINSVARKCSAYTLAAELGQLDFMILICQFLHGQPHPDSRSAVAPSQLMTPTLFNTLPDFHDSEKITVYNSASATFYAH